MPITVKLDLHITERPELLLSSLRDALQGPEEVRLSILEPAKRTDHQLARLAQGDARRSDFTLMSSREPPLWLLRGVRQALSPMSLGLESCPAPSAEAHADLECVLVERSEQAHTLLRLTGDSAHIERLAESLTTQGLPQVECGARLTRGPQLSYIGAPPAVRRRLEWVARALQLTLPPPVIQLTPERAQGGAVELHLSTSELSSRLGPMKLRGDELEALIAMGGALGRAGALVRYDVLTSEGAREELPWFELRFGALSYDQERCEALYLLVREALDALGYHEGRAPLVKRYDRELIGWEGQLEGLEALRAERSPTLTLPTSLAERGLLGDPSPESRRHWLIRVYTDDVTRAASLIGRIEALGYLTPELVEVPPRSLQAELCYPATCPQPLVRELSQALSQVVERSASERAPEQGTSARWVHTRAERTPSRVVTLSVNFDDLNPVRYYHRRAELSASCSVLLKCETLKAVEPLWAALKQLELASLTLKEGEVDERQGTPVIVYGGAARLFVSHLQALVEHTLALPCELDQRWGEEDQELWLLIPSAQGVQGELSHPQGAELSDWFPLQAGEPAQGPLVERHGTSLFIADLSLLMADVSEARDLARVPQLEDFEGYCLDQATAESLYHVAEAVALAEPCLLEGPTSASKTSVILYLAALLRQPVARLNLSAQTDTGELIGRYTPSEEGWRWSDGLVVEALSRGWWLILDELNLAEPQVLERLNSLLERSPSLTLSERDGRLIGGAGAPIHERFRVFATMNPAEYVGRAPLSPAYRDRWLADRLVSATSERALLEMISLQVWGRAPEVELFGLRYEGRLERGSTGAAPSLSGLTHLSEAEAISAALARFHYALAQALEQRSAGLRLGESTSSAISRRSLLATLDYLASALSTDKSAEEARPGQILKRAVWRYYVSRLRSSELRALAQTLWVGVDLERLCEQLGERD